MSNIFNGSKGNQILKGAMVLTFAGILSRGLGALYRIPLNRLAGPEIMALDQMVYPIYTTALAISTAGIPVAVAKLVADRKISGDIKGSLDIVRISTVLLGFLSGIVTIILIISAPLYGRLIAKTQDVILPVIAISPAVFFVSVMAVYRGFFQGMEKMLPYALSQIFEQIFRVITALTALFFIGSQSNIFIASLITLGPTVGSFIGLMVIWVCYRRFIWKMEIHRCSRNVNTGKILIELVSLAYPIIIGNIIIPVMNLIDVAITNGQLHKIPGITGEEVRILFGYLTSYAGSLIYIPTVITMGIAISMVPTIAKSQGLKDWKSLGRKISSALKATALVSYPAAVGLLVMAEPINVLLFNDRGATLPLMVLSIGIPFITLNQTATSILHGLGKTKVPVVSILFGVMVKLTTNYFLTPIPQINILGAAFGTVLGFGVAAALNLSYIIRHIKAKLPADTLIIKPLLSSVIMGLSVYIIYFLLSAFLDLNIATIIAIAFGGIIYVLMVLSLKIFSKEEYAMLPFINKRKV